MIVIVDYGLGNVTSVAGAVKKLGLDPVISSRPQDIAQAEKLILPGVGAFGDGMKNLRGLGLVDLLNVEVIQKKKPILGICLGAQLMAKDSFEFGHHQGLSWIDASVVKLDVSAQNLSVPHVGWNDLVQTKADMLWDSIPADALFYYVHSFHIQCRREGIITGACDYGGRFTAAFHQDNIFATQFHPEKSQQHGLQVLHNFLTKA